MPKFIGAAGDFHKERSINRRLNAIIALFMAFAAALFCVGMAFGFYIGRGSLWSSLWIYAAIALIVPGFFVLKKLFDKQIRLARAEEDGADGEREFIKFLHNLPDTYTVFSDLDFADSYGNIDHLIIGPNGVFAIDVKNWRGTVAPDGKGELLLNDRPPDKPQIRRFTRRVMDLKDRLKALAKLDPYVQCVFAFMRTHVKAKWGATGAVHCIRADQIADYIAKFHTNKPIPPADLAQIVKAVQALQSFVQQDSKPETRNDQGGPNA
jgi:hypothetical protein